MSTPNVLILSGAAGEPLEAGRRTVVSARACLTTLVAAGGG